MRVKNIFRIMLFIGSFMIMEGYTAQSATASRICSKRTEEYYENGALRTCQLTDSVKIRGYPCQSRIRFNANGNLDQFELSEEYVIQGLTIPIKSTVFLDDNGRLYKCWFSKNITIQGIPCKGSAFSRVTTTFYENGRLEWCFLSKPTIIQGIPCKAGVFDIVGFYPNGSLRTCTLGKHILINGRKYTQGTKVTLDENGNVLSEKSFR